MTEPTDPQFGFHYDGDNAAELVVWLAKYESECAAIADRPESSRGLLVTNANQTFEVYPGTVLFARPPREGEVGEPAPWILDPIVEGAE